MAEQLLAFLQLESKLPSMKFLIFLEGLQELTFMLEIIFDSRNGSLRNHDSL